MMASRQILRIVLIKVKGLRAPIDWQWRGVSVEEARTEICIIVYTYVCILPIYLSALIVIKPP